MNKLCKICNHTKDISEFHKHPKMADGHLNMCKTCKTAYDKKRKEEKGDILKQKAKEAYQKNIEQRRERNRASYYAHAEKRKQKAKEYRDNNKEKYNKYFKEHHQAKKDDKDYMIKRRLVKHEYRQKKFNTADGTVTVDELKNLKIAQNNQCGYCGTDLAQLTNSDVHVDHIIPLSLGGSHTISNVVFACSTCNLAKGKTHPDVFGYPQFVQH